MSPSSLPSPLPSPSPSPASSGTAQKKHFDHERLEVYQRALQFLKLAHTLVEQVPRGHGHLADQLQRAATSIVLNIAEGAGEYARKEKARFYRMARRSATESAAVLDVCGSLGLIALPSHTTGRQQLLEVVAMLVRMVTNLGDTRADEP